MNMEQNRSGFSEIFDRELAARMAAKAASVGKKALWPEIPPVELNPDLPAVEPEDQQ